MFTTHLPQSRGAFAWAIIGCSLLCYVGGCAPGVGPADDPGGVAGAAETVGELIVTKQVMIGGLAGLPDMEVYDIWGDFHVIDLDAIDMNNLMDFGDYEDFMEGITTETETFGACVVTSTSFNLSGLPEPGDELVEDDVADDIVAALDPGTPGVARTAAATVELQCPEDDDDSPVSMPRMYSPSPLGVDLLELGFDAGQAVTFEFPGGADIGAFSASIDVAEDLNVTTPDLSDADFKITPGQALAMGWNAGVASQFVTATIYASNMPTADVDEGAVFLSVMIQCEFPDDGSDTVPAGATAYIPDDATMTGLMVSRTRSAEVGVPLIAGGTGKVALSSEVGVLKTWFAFEDLFPDLPDIPDIPDGDDWPDIPDDFDPDDWDLPDMDEVCAMIGMVWNPETEECEPAE